MPSLRSEATVEAVDVERARALVPALLAEWRALVFDDDGLLHRPAGARHAGLRVQSGAHPAVGTAYRITVPVPPGPDEPDASDESWVPAEEIGGLRFRPLPVTLTLLEDSSSAVKMRVDREDVVVDVMLVQPDRADTVGATVDYEVKAPHAMRGRLSGQATAYLDQLARPVIGAHQITGAMKHRRLAGQGDVEVTADGRLWDVVVDARFHGRGLFRIPIMIAGPFIGRALQKEFDKEMRNLPEHVAKVNRALASTYDESPQAVAARLFDQAVAEIDNAGSGR